MEYQNEKAQAFYRSLRGKHVAFCGIGGSNLPLIRSFPEKGALVTARDKRSREQLGALAEELEAGASLPPSGASACAEASTVSPSGRSALSEERIALIQERIDSWCVQRGYKDYSINFMTLSRSLSISKADLAVYFSQRLHTTFRVWLSDIRFRAAQSMMLEHPHYSNDVISAECGFSSRTQLYRIFKAKEGCTPTAWRERQSQQDLLGR